MKSKELFNTEKFSAVRSYSKVSGKQKAYRKSPTKFIESYICGDIAAEIIRMYNLYMKRCLGGIYNGKKTSGRNTGIR